MTGIIKSGKNVLAAEYHATAIAIGKAAVMFVGGSASGKSDIALRLIDRGAKLIGDDRVVLKEKNGALYAFPHDALCGMLEIRGVGIIRIPYVKNIPVRLIINTGNTEPDRFPEEIPTVDIAGVPVPLLGMNVFEQSAPIKAERALERILKPKRFVQ